ncbi:hypothetical protein ACT4Y5_07860 [Acinetobacter baumannii]
MTPQERLQVIINQAEQFDIEKIDRRKIENDLHDAYRQINTLENIVKENVNNLIFTELDNFLAPQGWRSEVNSENGRDYKLGIKYIWIVPTDTASKKQGYLVSHDLFEGKTHRIEVSFKDTNIARFLIMATNGLVIHNDMKNEELNSKLEQFQMIKNKFNEINQDLNFDILDIEVTKVGQNAFKKQPNLIEAFLTILENK